MNFLTVSVPLKILVAADMVTKTMVERMAIVVSQPHFSSYEKWIGYGNHVIGVGNSNAYFSSRFLEYYNPCIKQEIGTKDYQ